MALSKTAPGAKRIAYRGNQNRLFVTDDKELQITDNPGNFVLIARHEA
jgi:hypothetical protein